MSITENSSNSQDHQVHSSVKWVASGIIITGDPLNQGDVLLLLKSQHFRPKQNLLQRYEYFQTQRRAPAPAMHQETEFNQAVFLKSQHENIADTNPRDLRRNERCLEATGKNKWTICLRYVQHVIH